jgi:hypothetical protein
LVVEARLDSGLMPAFVHHRIQATELADRPFDAVMAPLLSRNVMSIGKARATRIPDFCNYGVR